MKIVYDGPSPEISLDGIVVKRMEPVSFPDALAHRVLEQASWHDPSDPRAVVTHHTDGYDFYTYPDPDAEPDDTDEEA